MKQRARKKTAAPKRRNRTPPKPAARKVIRARPDSAVAAVTKAFTEHRMAAMSQQHLVNLHNKIAKRRKKSFDDVAVMNAAKIAALAKGASLKR